ncbi:DUF6090 family protein [Polaribacter aquimarinus]|uniref:Uncharacterized protein n=2 Tax=Polaribacter TaxID=52959 RepID=A0A2U2JDQ4_9FLAO|nr:DUF6090 family protein [Polaribacter aquimarinus]PWG06467.1 hypothetical protein DIS07_01145 [Polaribacter aquimarinus]
MIKFFRKIRQNLLMENKTSKYFKYAIGEIVLVVIGILIALQINNNNEVKKDRVFEIKMLKEVRKEIIKDTFYFNMLSKRTKTASNGAQNLINLIIQKKTNLDSVSKAIGDMSTGIVYLYHKGAYETIKSVGFDKISNDSLRFALTDLYDFSLPRTKQLLSRFEKTDKSITQVDRRFQILSIIGTKNLDGKITTQNNLKKSFFTDPEIVKMAINIRENNKSAFWRLQNIIEECTLVLQLLDKELKME